MGACKDFTNLQEPKMLRRVRREIDFEKNDL